ncbi:hypothetical protein GCM10019016_075520 [Streptomyces prasinosporus]|uniref:Zinc ribbon domain-containing protein n=1 Tax=Streptomyces prasinosporus TaxID=68256 RepID=A0ABP6U1M9_9ACTN
MDYCSTCRRHLNGALVCPGCGAYAPDIAPSVIGGRAVPGTTTSAVPAAATAVAAPSGRPGDGAAAGPARTREAPPDDVPPAVSAPTGRAARRRQLARWRKTQRRALVATAVALVGGGLTLASADRGTGDRARAAAAPDVTGMGGAEGPADRYGTPGPATPPGAHPSAPGRSAQSSPAGDGDRRPDGAAPAPTAPAGARADGTDGTDGTPTPVPASPRTTAPAPAPDALSGPAAGSVASGTGDSGATTPPTAPPPAADDDTGGSDGTGGTDRNGSQPAPSTPSAPSTAPPDSSRLCLLVICLG